MKILTMNNFSLHSKKTKASPQDANAGFAVNTLFVYNLFSLKAWKAAKFGSYLSNS